jgi:magnesium chelatase family protein
MTLLKNTMEKINLSARAYDRILKVSRIIADFFLKALISESSILPKPSNT